MLNLIITSFINHDSLNGHRKGVQLPINLVIILVTSHFLRLMILLITGFINHNPLNGQGK
jgi:hypothetical protein